MSCGRHDAVPGRLRRRQLQLRRHQHPRRHQLCSGRLQHPADTADFKVGAIYINGQNDTAGYTFQHHSGITKAMENLGLDPASQLLIVDNVAEDYTAVSNAIDTLAGQGANIIFGISFGYIDAMNDKAEEYPRDHLLPRHRLHGQ